MFGDSGSVAATSAEVGKAKGCRSHPGLDRRRHRICVNESGSTEALNSAEGTEEELTGHHKTTASILLHQVNYVKKAQCLHASKFGFSLFSACAEAHKV